jgi:NitT/TauT family transport system substrate-binding protein
MHQRIIRREGRRGRIHLWSVLGICFLLIAGACNSVKSKAAPLRLGLSDWPGHAPFYAAAQLGNFGSTPVEIKGFSSNFDRNRAFAQGRLEVLAAPLFDALRIADDGTPLKIVLLFDYSSGGDGIVARKEITTVAELKGKRVSAELSAITHFMLLAALSQAGLSENDVQIVNLSVPEAADAFAHGKLDAATLWDPHLSRQAAAPGAHKLFTSKQIPGQIIDVLVVQKEIADKRPEDVANIIRGWERTLAAWRARPAELEAVMAKATNRTPDALRSDLAGMVLLDLANNTELFAPGASSQSVWSSFAATASFMDRHRLLKHAAPDAREFLEPRFIAQANAK